MKRILSLFLACILALPLVACSGERKPITLLDSGGKVIAEVTRLEFSDSQTENPKYRSYVSAAIKEAAEIIAAQEGCSADEAELKLFKGGYTLKTAFEQTAFSAINTMYGGCAIPSVGVSMLAADGRVLALYSAGETLCGTEKHAPFSTIKPLAIYAPSIEKGLIDWSTGIVDEPFTQITDESGNKQDWPTNPSGGYTYQKTPIVECIRKSLNTAAVFSAKDLGVKNALDFLSESLGLDVSFEQERLALEGEDEIIGNVALGYLSAGFTPSELAGCYQIFARGGKYIKPYIVTEISDKNGETVYTHTSEEKQVISEETAYIMNRMLTSVTSPGGTGEAAEVEGCEVFGKTGTGTEEAGNWFVGVTPEYSCAVWHGSSDNTGNHAAALFSEIMKNMPAPQTEDFSVPEGVRKGVFCSESGLSMSPSCVRMQVGYYANGKKPRLCNAH